MAPINYSQYFPQNRTALDQAMAGYQYGTSIAEAQQRQELMRLKQEEIEKQKMQAEAMQKELVDITYNDKSGPEEKFKKLSNFVIRNPTMAEHLKTSIEGLSEEAKKNEAARSLGVYTALYSGMTDKAITMLEEDRDAAKNSGDEGEARMAQGMIDMIQNGNIEAAQTASALYASWSMGPEKAAENFKLIQEELRAAGREPIVLEKMQAESNKAIKELTLSDLDEQLKQADLEAKQFQNQFNKETSADKKAELKDKADTARMNKELKALQLANKSLERNDEKRRNAEKIGAVLNEGELVFNDIERFKKAIKNQPLIFPATGLRGKIMRKLGIPGSAAVDLEALKSTIVSHIALNKISELKSQSKTGATGFGQLSEKELQLLVDSVESLDLNQSETNLLRNIGIIEKQYRKIEDKIKGDPRYQEYLDYVEEQDRNNELNAAEDINKSLANVQNANVPDFIKGRSYLRHLK